MILLPEMLSFSVTVLPACMALFPLRAADAASARWGSSASSSASTSTSVLNEVR